jgi:ribosomal protein S24E
VVVDYMRSEFGMPVTVGYAKAYKTKDSLQAIERKHILKRNAAEEKKEEEQEAS